MAMGLAAPWYRRGVTFVESSIPCSHGRRALVVKGVEEMENAELNSKYQDKAVEYLLHRANSKKSKIKRTICVGRRPSLAWGSVKVDMPFLGEKRTMVLQHMDAGNLKRERRLTTREKANRVGQEKAS
ncbi:hypothetical protein GW17_00026964 [Ensete ventricosum]|nr:hypothetical protein GW17_00026964 [Ensete ventricosum]